MKMLDLFDELNEMVRSGLIYTSLTPSEYTDSYLERAKQRFSNRVKLNDSLYTVNLRLTGRTQFSETVHDCPSTNRLNEKESTVSFRQLMLYFTRRRRVSIPAPVRTKNELESGDISGLTPGEAAPTLQTFTTTPTHTGMWVLVGSSPTAFSASFAIVKVYCARCRRRGRHSGYSDVHYFISVSNGVYLYKVWSDRRKAVLHRYAMKADYRAECHSRQSVARLLHRVAPIEYLLQDHLPQLPLRNSILIQTSGQILKPRTL